MYREEKYYERLAKRFFETYRRGYSALWAMWLRGKDRFERVEHLKAAVHVRQMGASAARKARLRLIFARLLKIEKSFKFGGKNYA